MSRLVGETPAPLEVTGKSSWGKHPIAPACHSGFTRPAMKENKILQEEKLDDSLFECQTNPPQRILVAEDDDDIRRLNVEVLTDSGYEVDAAEDGACAWDALQLNSYDLLITDNNMRKMSGVELLKKLHAARMTLPVILTSGTMPVEELKRHPWLQIEAKLHKPYTLAKLLGTAGNVLRATSRGREQVAPLPNWPSQPLPNRLRL
jgi:CheY-like chemotaxis protein